MGTLNIWFVIIGAVIACRALSFAAIQWEMFGLRKSMTIERLLNEQKTCDALIGVYHLLVTTVGIWMMIMGSWEIFNQTIPPQTISMATPIVLITGFLGYISARIYFEAGYDLGGYYNEIVDYRKKQETVTKDNDNEVTFLRSYRRVKRHFWYSIVWMIFLFMTGIICKHVLYSHIY